MHLILAIFLFNPSKRVSPFTRLWGLMENFSSLCILEELWSIPWLALLFGVEWIPLAGRRCIKISHHFIENSEVFMITSKEHDGSNFSKKRRSILWCKFLRLFLGGLEEQFYHQYQFPFGILSRWKAIHLYYHNHESGSDGSTKLWPSLVLFKVSCLWQCLLAIVPLFIGNFACK